MSRKVQLLALALPLTIAAACGSDNNNSPSNTATVRFVNATNTSMDASNGGTVSAGNGALGYGANSSCMQVNTSGSSGLAFNQSGTVTSIPGFTQNFNSGGNYTVVAYPGASGTTQFYTIDNTGFSPSTGMAGVRFFNGAYGSGNLVMNANGTALGSGAGIGFGNAGAFTNIGSGAQAITFNTGTGTSTVANAGSLNFSGGNTYTVLVAPPSGALAEGGSPGDDVRERRLGRMASGYDGVVHWLARDLHDRIRLGAVVTRVQWGRGEVVVDAGADSYLARAVIVAVPLGVLQSEVGAPGAIAFEPPLAADARKRDALATLEMGQVYRVTLKVRERFWATERFAKKIGNGNLDQLSFLHGDDDHFPVWWTGYPAQAPVLVAWSGGPHAATLAGRGHDAVVEAAIDALGGQFGIGAREARRQVQAAWTHDWIADPFSRGAYSYLRVGGADSPAALARPLRTTLFFAGEATDPEGRNGTVHGAIATGRRAARELARTLGA